ncbi:hypothetical protein [Paraburkholderia sp. J67]|uniref:hypothetical protein n=1 Tax=Paraburkholderia sp. J67 TaxID=2805435 RepID=UPI002ABD902D|nr:hypothetical protein [Paraburkholderia sp. J67]
MKLATVFVASGLAAAAVTAFAAPTNRYPNLEQAQQLIDQSYAHIETARKDNHDDFGGHASRAEELLRQAKGELDQAAMYRDRH